MQKEMGYKERFEIVQPWLEQIISIVKKDLRQEHLKIDRDFCRRYFLGKNALQVSTAEMAAAYALDIAKGNVGLGEFIASRWVLRHTDIYEFFEEKLKNIQTDFDQMSSLPEEFSWELMNQSIQQYGAVKTFLFSVLNAVVFPDTVYHKLRQLAVTEHEQQEKKNEEVQIAASLEAMQKRHTRELAATSERYEKKLSGLQKKYLQDTKNLKNQISQLQKKLEKEDNHECG